MAINFLDYVEEGRWHDRINYQCRLCPFATIESQAAILRHLQGNHFERRRPPAPTVLVANLAGNEVELPRPPAEWHGPINVSPGYGRRVDVKLVSAPPDEEEE